MSRLPRIFGTVCIVVGAIAIVVGGAVYLLVRSELSAQNITVSSDANYLAGKPVTGPLTAYSQAVTLNNHALEAGNGKTYAELDKSDPNRNTVMTADFLQASLYTSVVAFGVSFLIAILGVMFVFVGLTFRELAKRTEGDQRSIDLRNSVGDKAAATKDTPASATT
jgi:hypothetical protein